MEAAYVKPSINYDAWSKEKKSVNLDAKAMYVLFCILNKEEFNRVSTITSVHQYGKYYR